ncbi:hypothetical protein SBC1_33410 [Caballeronia sp. SBC1]|uniref:TolC family protein n=1 Tax=Caballeronia sp. SBC1 TaxID=2705548 RepID=UPI001407FFCE|nr:TolC family protein [Caballeronia sp. SBC1]QIN63302.1 hypothetical protein SBC1_33410 [Caballeronia sp. SBC1]
MTHTSFAPRKLIAALMFSGICASASAAENENLARMVDRMINNRSIVTPTANPLQLAQQYIEPPRRPKKVDVSGALDGQLLASPAADKADAQPAQTAAGNTQSSPATDRAANVAPANELAGNTMDLARSLDAATDNALTTKIARGQADQAQARVMGARSAYYPKVSVIAKTADKVVGAAQGYGRSYDQAAQASATLQYTVFDFGRRKNQVQSAMDASRWSAPTRWATTERDVFTMSPWKSPSQI